MVHQPIIIEDDQNPYTIDPTQGAGYGTIYSPDGNLGAVGRNMHAAILAMNQIDHTVGLALQGSDKSDDNYTYVPVLDSVSFAFKFWQVYGQGGL
jgi:hypothetical protein